MASERRLALLVDWGGVMTRDLFHSFAAFCTDEGLDPSALTRELRANESARTLVTDLETGRMSEAAFEREFAAVLGVGPDRLVDRLFARSSPDDVMQEAVLLARRAGIPTGLLSNSWGTRRYPRARLAELFDATTISGEVGMRKPDPEIYALAARRAGTDAERCVFVDDIPSNLEPAAALGMRTVHHVETADTIAELEELLGVSLRG